MDDIIAQAEKEQREHPAKPRPGSQASLLNREAMQDLFRKQRDELKANRERIRKVRDGAREPDLAPRVVEKPASARGPAKMSGRLLKDLPRAQEAEPKMDLSMALTKNSSGQFLKSRTQVLQSLGMDLGGEEEDEDEHSVLNVLLEKAKALNDALDTLENPEPVDAPDKEMSNAFFLHNRVLNFPAIHDSDSLAYRAEAIRAFLEREMGLDKMLSLKRAVGDQNPESEVLDSFLKDYEAGIVVLARQLLVLEACF
jgi:hypothetical protein